MEGICMAFGLSIRGSASSSRGGCRRHPSRTQLYLECCCACRRHLRCHLERRETSVRPRFMGSSRTSHGLALSTYMEVRDINRNREEELKAKQTANGVVSEGSILDTSYGQQTIF